jgi:Mg2+/Co2+ transporter CorB
VTFCTIFGTALATDVAVQLFGKRGVGLATLAVTAVTLFFGEILPKSLAVTKPESVARATLPLISASADTPDTCQT